MIKIGLTGGIGSGKSTVSLMFKSANFPLIDADIIAREVLKKYPEILDKVRMNFGDNFFDWRGEFRRKEFGNHIFRFPKERVKYENIIIPYIKKEIFNEFDNFEKAGEKVVILDAPTLIETKLNEDMDYIILVWVDNKVQLTRLKERDKLTQGEAINRINSQLSLDRKKDFANFIIDNGGSLIETKKQVDDIIDILNMYK
ncbi:dephospho-CoA kinase [Clostridium fallax]|uniref:Dephospho-CoA kinase n=1 Tax=Clostridium fallax TaxID=1533 RepID=A0A1M4WWI2_9CLOT|nr:dephospho-CoA kinase [Clostridium fallax]SHE85596.1 dephospho-CoA kinase [Clostridium fallax]SQB07446.1 dephospho-CoA kinase [Clostridium fallax]